MPEEKDKIKKLYDTFVSDGYDMESEEDFRKNLLDSTKRKAAYDALVKDGYDMEPFEEFESNIGFGKERTSSQQSGNSASGTVEEPISPANEQTWQPTEKEKVAMLTETDRIMNDVKSHTQTFNERIDNMQEYGINPGLQTKEGKMIFNPESGKLEKTFLTPAGNRYYSKSLADMESFQYRQAADMSIGGQLRKANLRLQELKAKQAERASEVHKEWAEETENNKAPLAAILGAATYTPRQQSDKENRALSVAIRETEELIKNLEEQKDRENGVDVGFWRGFGRTMGDVRTWDFGMGDMRDAFTMMNADELKKENATEGEREAHDAMMGAIHEKQQAEERYSGNADFWNRAGVMTGYMPSFMLDFVLTGGGFNGLSSFSKGSTKLATKVISKETAEKMAQQGFKSYIKENGAKGLGRYASDWTIKALGTTADDLLVRAPLMANTVQAGKTTADIIDRKLGDVVVDENGNYDFSNDKTWGDAIWQSEANAIIENYSEMFGAHLDPVFTLGNMSKLANVLGAKRIGAVLSKADASALNGIMGQTHQMFNKMGVSDYVGEVSEEYYGQLWRTMLNLDDAYQQNPDGTRTNLFASGQFHGDIWGGMALSMGLMGAGKHTLSAANYTSMKHGVNKADAKVNELLGKEVWEPLKATLDLTTNENIGEVAELIAGDKDFTINEKAAVLDYMERSLNLRGFNLASMAQSRGGNRNESVQQANDSYLDGYNIISSQEMNDAKNMYEYQRARVADLVDESMFAMIEENPIAALEFVNGNEQWNDEDKVSVIDYINAKQVYNGMIQRVRDDIDGRIEQSNSMIDARVNHNTGMIQGATMKQDERKVYVISGKLVPYDDGSGVSVTDSDNSIIIRDSETGALEQVSPDTVLSLDESQDPNEQKELAEQAIVEQFAREAADKIDGKVTFNPGDAYTITGQDGSQMQVQIIANEDGIVDNGDGTVNVSDGVNIFPLTKETIQQQADAANLARVAQFEQQRTIENAERKQEMQEAERPQYALNDIVSLTDENGVTVRGNITADADADGKYEVFTEAPINGKRVNLFTRDELDNMLLEHNGVAFERPAENESNNGAENIPENDNNAPQNIPAMQRIPKDEQGNPLYEQADSDTAWDAIVEQTEGDEDMAQTVADGMVADKEEALKKLEKAKSKGGNSIAEKIASEKERKAAIDAAKQDLLAWQKIAGTAKRRKMEADDERRRIADEAAALRKAEEEKLRADIPEERIIEVVKELAKLGVKVKDDTTDILQRNGIGAYNDDEVSYENDPVAKLLGQSRRTAKQRREFARRERQRMAERVESLAEKLHLDNVEVVTDASVLDGKKQRAKGFYSKSTGKITIVIPNHTSTFDVEQTLLHEAVAHYGLRQLFGKHFDTFLDNVFNNADENIRRRIVDMAAKNGWDFHKATEEYLASLAEDTEFENINASWWQQIKDFFLNMLHKIGFEDFRGVTLSDNELRYILWRSYENLAEPGRYRNILGEAADVAKQYELKVGNYAVSDPHHQTVAESDDALYRTGDPEIHERELARDRYERRVKSGMFQSQEALQDSMLGLKEAMTAILGKETNIEDVDGFENAYLGENRLSSVNKAEADAFAHTLFKPMLDEVAKLARTEAEREELTDYMMAKHGLERNTYMRNEAINNGATDADQTDYAGLTSLTGIDNVTDAETEAQIMVNDYEQAHDTTDLWKKVNAASKAILSKSYECGMMSKATFDKISDMYDFYIPLRGFDEKTSSEAYAYLTHKQSAFNAPIKKAEGRRSKADDPFANLQSMAEGAIMQGNRNKLVKQRFLNFALNHSSDLVSVSDIWVEYDTVADEWKPVFPDNIDSTDTPEVVERKMLDFETKMESLAQQYPDRYKHGKDTVNIPYRIVESRDMRQHQIVVKRGGRDYVITINGNPRAAQALNGQTNPDNDMSGAIGAILRAGENINRQLSAFYTTRNPDFIVSNFMRDMLYTNTMTWIRESPNYALRFHRNYMYANPVRIKQLLAKHRKGTLDMSNKTEAMFHQFMMNGGETGYANIRDIEQHKNDIRRELKKSNGKIPVKKAWDLLGERFDEYNRAVENCARFAAFMTSREMGRSIDRAIYDAKEISVNFNKKGSGAKFYDSTGQTKAGNASALVSGLGRSGYVFWNAAIQGTANFGRQMKRHPAKAFTGIAAMFLLGAIVAYLGGDDDDDDDKNAYYNLPEYVRRSNILFRAGNSWVSIPLPVEYRAVYGMGELMISVLNGKEHLTGEEIAEAITGQATQILPIDFLEGGGGLNAFVPSAYKPLWEAYVAEKSWTGMPLYKDTPYNKDMPEWTKAYKSANKYIVGLANAMNEATGGDPYTKGTIDFNPAKIEYMLNGYFGGVFGTIDKLSKTAETITDNRDYDPRSFLLVNRLVKAGDERTEYRAVNNEYFRLKEEHDRLKSRLKRYEEDTDNDIFDYAEKIDFLYNSPEYERYEIFEDYRRDIDDLYNELNDTVDDEERKNIEAELNELKKEMIEEMNKTRK